MRRDRATLDVADGVAELVLTRPEAGNAIDPPMVEAIDAAVRAVETDPAVRAMVIHAEGRAFCVGGDLRHFAARLDRMREELASMVGVWHRSTLRRLSALPVPVVVAVQGGIGGGGLGLLWGADVVIAADDLVLATGFARLGMTGDGGSTWYLPRLVGARRARELMLRSTPVRAAEALALGLVSRVVPTGELTDAARADAAAFAAGPTWAYGRIKTLIADAEHRDHAAQLLAELDAMVEGAERADVREGVSAFVERREPSFDGR
jgi:2-(1,2-epoxy-1,2-dihydrophenyl)acetyl-CoA isomerase